MSSAEFGTEAEGAKILTCAEFTSYALCISPYMPWLLCSSLWVAAMDPVARLYLQARLTGIVG